MLGVSRLLRCSQHRTMLDPLRLPEWKRFPVSIKQLSIPTVLRCGQSFRWKNTGQNNELWSCALSGRIIHLKQDDEYLHYRAVFPQCHRPKDDQDDTLELLKDYFNLSVDLEKLYEKWSSLDPIFTKQASKFSGVRILRQDPWENLISFICSSNNNISRISQMVEKLCVHWGEKLGEVEGIEYFDFPQPERLFSGDVESELRALGFGYRARYISQTAKLISNEKGISWLHSLRKMPYKEAHKALLELSGVGPKVADCVCLMSLDKMGAVPVDTHVWTIAWRDYKFRGGGKAGKTTTMTGKLYEGVGDFFRNLWGEEAGWAHSVLFTGELRAFSEKKMGATKRAVTTEVENESVKIEEGIMEENKTKIIKRGRDDGGDTALIKEELDILKDAVEKDINTTTSIIRTTTTTVITRRSKRRKKG